MAHYEWELNDMQNAPPPPLQELVAKRLHESGVETPFAACPASTEEMRIAMIRDNMEAVVRILGLDHRDDSLVDTPKRIGKMYVNELFYGLNYEKFPECTTVENKFHYVEPLVMRDIDIKSMCEHHFMPIVGKATIAYIPGKKVLGLSKFARVADFFSSRPQVQERLTMQIGLALSVICGTDDIYVSIRADHMCMNFRGIEDPCANTETFYRSGKFKDLVI